MRSPRTISARRYDFNLYIGEDQVGTISLTVEVGTPGYMGGQQQIGHA